MFIFFFTQLKNLKTKTDLVAFVFPLNFFPNNSLRSQKKFN